jgi:hypothetical protein
MATLHHNISGTTTTKLLSAGDIGVIRKISICNTNSSNEVTVDLYIQKVNAGKFYLLSNVIIPTKVTLLYDGVTFGNKDREFSLYIKCTGTSPTVDVILD